MRNDVFLSFRGVDIRKTFISHLLSSLKKKGITAFTASDPSSFDLHAIEKSEVAITVISKNNECLDWWVDEVAKIIECEKIGTLKTVLVFFQVDPSYVLSGFAHTEKFTEMDGTQREKLEMVKKWLDAHLTNKSCFNSRDWKDDSELVDKITGFVSEMVFSDKVIPAGYRLIKTLEVIERVITSLDDLGSKSIEEVHKHWSPMLSMDLGTSSILPPQGSPLFWTTIDSSACLAYSSRCLHELSALVLDTLSRVVGICGQEGVGKTYLARHVSEEISPQFQHSLYITNFSNKIQRQDNSYRPSLPLIFACKSLKESSFHGSSDDAIKEIMGRRKVLVIVDDVDDIEDLKGIIKDASRFGPGSRVIVITQDRSLLTQSGVKHIYEVECPKDEEALAFFSEFAFKQRKPFRGFEALSCLALKVSNHLPLALKVLGSFLFNKEKDEWVSTLRRLEASHYNYTAEVCRCIGADDYAPRRPIKVDRHIGVDEANRLPFYCFALK